jgi:hypothetical protein
MHAASYRAFVNNKKHQERDKAGTTDKSPHLTLTLLDKVQGRYGAPGTLWRTNRYDRFPALCPT